MPTPLPTEPWCEVVLDGPAEYDRADFQRFIDRGGAIRTNGYPITFVGTGLSKPQRQRHMRWLGSRRR